MSYNYSVVLMECHYGQSTPAALAPEVPEPTYHQALSYPPTLEEIRRMGGDSRDYSNNLSNIYRNLITEANIPMPSQEGWPCTGTVADMITFKENKYRELCKNPALTPDAYAYRHLSPMEKMRVDFAKRRGVRPEPTQVFRFPTVSPITIRSEKISALAVRESLTAHEAEAVLAHVSPSDGYTKDTLLALQIINRFARTNKIEKGDAITVFREYA